MTRAREMANIFTSGIATEAVLEAVSSASTAILPEVVKLQSGGSADGGTVSSASGLSDSSIYSIISDNNTYTYDGGSI